MTNEFDDIITGIYRCFSDFNGETAKNDLNYQRNRTEISEADLFVNEINRHLKCRGTMEECPEDEAYKTIKIMLPKIEIPEFKLSLCKKAVSIKESEISDLCNKIKSGLKMRYLINDNEDITYFDDENKEWIRLSDRENMKYVEEVGKVINKTVKDTGEVIKTGFDNAKCSVNDLSKGIDKTLKKTVKKGSQKIQPLIKAQTENINSKLQESYEDLVKQLEGYKKQLEEAGGKLKQSTTQLSLQKEQLSKIDTNLEVLLKEMFAKIEIPVPCLVIRKDVVSAGIEVKYPKRYEYVMGKIFYLAEKAAKGEMMEVIMKKVNEFVLDAKMTLESIVKEALQAGIRSFIESIKKSLELIGDNSIDSKEIKCSELDYCKTGQWETLQYE